MQNAVMHWNEHGFLLWADQCLGALQNVWLHTWDGKAGGKARPQVTIAFVQEYPKSLNTGDASIVLSIEDSR